ncbi:hypothetical protein EV702DRAFT_1279221, partial [Suillus placidus]
MDITTMMLVLAIEALDGGISSSNAITMRPQNDPSWWPFISSALISSYFVAAGSAGIMYDWALTFGQEVELIWRQRWSLMTLLYLSVRYVGILFAVINILLYIPTVSETDAVSQILFVALDWTSVVVNVLLGVIMITRLYAMYQRSRKVLILLVVVFLSVNIANGVLTAILTSHIS